MTFIGLQKVLSEIGQIFFYLILKNKLSDCKTVLDLGCGNKSQLQKVKKNFYSEGIDIFQPYIEESKKKKIHDRYKIGDIRLLSKLYKPKSFDAILALDVIEHLKAKEVIKLNETMEKIARKKIIILTPNGINKQDVYDNNPYQIHRSTWDKKKLEKLGYKIYGLRGLKYLRNSKANIKYKPYLFWGFLSFISEILLYRFPSLSFDLFAVKRIIDK